ncbi:MAG: cobalamin-binding protein [Ilumatobacteraceae bacterium]
MRIVSLLPSATEMICDLGLRDSLVGRSEECNWPNDVASLSIVSVARVDSLRLDGRSIDEAVRNAVGSGEQLYFIDEEVLRALKPDVIVTQDLCRVCAVSSNDVCDVGARVVSLDPRTIDEVAESVRTLGAALDVADRGDAVARRILERVDAVREATRHLPRVRTFFAEWLDPPFASGHWIPEMVAAAGGDDVLGRAGEPSRSVTWADVRAARPDVVILGPCGFDVPRAQLEAQSVRQEFDPTWRTVAVNADRYFARPAPSIADGVEQLGFILHGVGVPNS